MRPLVGSTRSSQPGGSGASAFCTEVQEAYKGGRLPARFWNANRNERAASPDGSSAVDDGTSGAPYLIAMANFQEFVVQGLKVLSLLEMVCRLLLTIPILAV